MNRATEYLIGSQDFQSFSKVKTDVKNFDCEIYKAEWVQNKNINIFRISANRFLRGMVRAIVGTLLNVGEGKQNPQYIQEVINARSRKSAGQAVPPSGLYLTEVLYPKSLFEV
jgi:tRNA pseudouridine38-40 synthase